jgi:Xaa-Pro aminopeptidase
MSLYAERRAAVMNALAGGGVAVIPAATTIYRNADTEFSFRQNSDFYYLTGFDEPDAVLVLAPHAARERTTLFVRPRDREREIWTGRRAGVEGALERFGADAAYPIEEFDTRLADALVGAASVYAPIGEDDRFDRRVFAAVREARYRVRRGGTAPRAYVDPGTIVHELRLFKTPAELEIMRRAAAATAAGFSVGMRATRPGLPEARLQSIMEHEYRLQGAQTIAYPSIVAGGDNALILHYNTNDSVLRGGELVLVDSGSEVDKYASDVTRTWPVNGRFSAEQRAIYEIVLAAQKAAIACVAPGRAFNEYHDAAVRVIASGLRDLGLVSGSIDQIIEEKSYFAFYPHNTGHWLGLDVHDAGRYTDENGYRKLAPGMVLTVEPGIYVQRDLDCDERFKGIGVRIEDDVVCTAEGNEILTAAIAKEIDDLERLVGHDALVGV